MQDTVLNLTFPISIIIIINNNLIINIYYIFESCYLYFCIDKKNLVSSNAQENCKKR